MRKEIVTNIHYSREDVKEITLLTIEQARRLPKKNLKCLCYWWLSSPHEYTFHAPRVSHDGFISDVGSYVDNDDIAVRPAFVIPNLEDTNGKIYVGKIPCTKIDKDLALADKCLCEHRFDPRSNDWETSELKRLIESDGFWNYYIGEDE